MLNGKIFIWSNLQKKAIGGWIFYDQEGFSRGKSKKSSRNPDFFSTFTFWWNWYSDNPNISVDLKQMIILVNLLPLRVSSDIEGNPGAGATVGKPRAAFYSFHLHFVTSLILIFSPPISRSHLSSFFPSSSCRKSGHQSETFHWQYYVYNSVSQMNLR